MQFSIEHALSTGCSFPSKAILGQGNRESPTWTPMRIGKSGKSVTTSRTAENTKDNICRPLLCVALK